MRPEPLRQSPRPCCRRSAPLDTPRDPVRVRPLLELLESRTLLSTAGPPQEPAPPATDATVAGRSIFYNHSVFDGNDAAANALDDLAVSPAVVPLLPNQRATPSNVSGYARGINGVMVDVEHLASDTLSADDFVLRVGNDLSDPSAWPAAPAPSQITIRRGAGVNGTDRITLVWPDGAIRNAWLQVTILDTADTGLSAPDVFSFASLAGDSAAMPAELIGANPLGINRWDLIATRRALSGRRPVGISSGLDHNRDGRVNARDLLVVRQNLASRLERVQAPGLPPVYYVSPSGDDANDGLGPLSAWRTAAKVNATPLSPGAHVLFQRGGEWHEQLAVSSSGTPEAPVVFGSYGTGPKPKFWGSDPLNPADFQPVAGTASTYRILPAGRFAVNSVQADHRFLFSAFRAAGRSGSAAVNLNYLNSHPDTWYQDESTGYVYVNTGGVDPRAGAVLYTASVRNNVVLVQGRHDVVLRNLVVDESAQFEGGYAFTILGSDNVTVERSEAYRAGKHHFGVINSGGFVGRDLYAAWAMPLQLYGEASAFVSYADFNFASAPRSSTWVNCFYEERPWAEAPYLSFYTHGTGMGDLTVRNMSSRGGIGMSIQSEGPSQHVSVTGGEIVDGRLALGGDNILVDGVALRGPHAGVSIGGSNNVVQNVLIDGARPDIGDTGAVINYGDANTVRFSTVRVDPASPWPAAAVVLKSGTGTRVYGNVIDAPRAFRLHLPPSAAFVSDHNLFARDPEFMLSDGSVRTLAQWQAELGQDRNSIVADPLFADPAAGDLALSPGSPAIDAFVATDLLQAIPTDFTGSPRPQGLAYDLGALERPA